MGTCWEKNGVQLWRSAQRFYRFRHYCLLQNRATRKIQKLQTCTRTTEMNSTGQQNIGPRPSLESKLEITIQRWKAWWLWAFLRSRPEPLWRSTVAMRL